MNKILQSIAPVILQAEHVRILNGGLESFCNSFTGLNQSFKQPFTSVQLNPEDKIQLDFTYNAANFCYWGDPKWTITYQGREVSGAYGMKAAFNRALEEGFPLLDPKYLESIREEDFNRIVRGSGILPLFKERVQFLRQVGFILNRRYDGKAVSVVDRSEGDALKLLDEITNNFACYDDFTEYKGNKVFFHKRAQLVVNNVHKILEAQGKGLARTNQLTALADYKVPQLLRNRSIIEYGQSLSKRIDTYQVIPAGSPEEVEIRAFTLEVCERIVTDLRKKFPDLKVIELDMWLYLESKKTSPNDKPHHRALTTAY